MAFTTHSDEKLLCLLQSGSEQALEAILLRYWDSLFVVAFKILGDRQVCEDAIQEIFIKIWQNREKLKVTYSLKAYLFAATRYEVYRQVKLLAVHARNTDLESLRIIEKYNPHDSLEYEELLQDVEKIINSLPDRCKQVYLLSREEQLSHKEIASRLQISIKTVENHITIALSHFRRVLCRTFL